MDLKLASQPVVVLANARTGTHLLRHILAAGDEFHDFGEIFNTAYSPGEPGGFWAFYRDRLQGDPERAIPTHENRAELFTDYIGHLDALSGAPCFLMDVKYAGVTNLNPYYHFPDRKPFLFEQLEKYDIPVIHLRRRNLLRQYCSEMLAKKTMQWTIYKGSNEHPPSGQTVTIDAGALTDNLNRLALRVEFFDACLAARERCLILHFEDLLQDGVLSRFARQSIGKLLNRTIGVEGRPQTKKISPPLNSFVANYRAVAEALAGTPYEEMLAGEHSGPRDLTGANGE